MSGKKFSVNGIKVELWKTCFRVEGMAHPVFIGPHCTEAHVKELVGAMYKAIRDRAIKAGKVAVAEAMKEYVKQILGER